MDPLASLIAWIAGYGFAGLIAIGLAERFVPVLPSYGVLVAIGIGAADGRWSLPLAVAATVAGGTAGSLMLFGLARGWRGTGGTRWLLIAGRWLGMSGWRMHRALRAFGANQRMLSFGAQLVPTLRLLSPMIAGLLQARTGGFAVATLCGIALWNGLFLGVGYLVCAVAPEVNASALALQVLVALVVLELGFAMCWRRMRRG